MMQTLKWMEEMAALRPNDAIEISSSAIFRAANEYEAERSLMAQFVEQFSELLSGSPMHADKQELWAKVKAEYGSKETAEGPAK